jgi:hypothetical protein
LGIVYNKTSLSGGITYPKRETLITTILIIEDIIALDYFFDKSLLTGPSYLFSTEQMPKHWREYIFLKNDWQNAFATANDVIF